MLARSAAFLGRHPAVKWSVIVFAVLLAALLALEIGGEIIISKYRCLCFSPTRLQP